ncbi:GspE/PulE family protein [Candidatus Endoriftia persephone]|jgi:general secretion pathway protein E/type IV pilus assembly protein PilB|uniref:General secretion pathway protein E n=4 Tax=Gammaproteobacteria TaxID=1236 RepID=G2FIU3_9GAMM|nr:GspE/PulE family protein [Candidatus Endoriftia persephone]EGV51413.1 general secretion pathway protein E [endosymbiont of Riftia pachyptila (vent Ph05)]EGW53278.1 general secretion pathway protein E [endosymbiont of Tevnia jerichonana (vent Tica)]USF87800.1 GspE/PulE family protein [Candidatus Endoriftia persephone]
MDAPVDKLPLGELLKARGVIGDEQIAFALHEHTVSGEKFGSILTSTGLVTEYDLALGLADQANIPYHDLDQLAIDANLLRRVNRNLCLSQKFLPVLRDENQILIATSSIDFASMTQTVTRHTGLAPEYVMVEESKLIDAIHHYYHFLDNPVEELLDREIHIISNDHSQARPVEQLLEHLFHLAAKHRASDIHLRPMTDTLNIAFRIDGVMRSMLSLPNPFKRLISSLKLKAGMDIAEQRLPQDGSFESTILNTQYYFRASTTVCPYGENMVVRILPMKSAFMGIGQLGFLEDDAKHMSRMFNEPFGLVLLTGPTGSGKTSSLYATLLTLNLLHKNVLTVENPIEFRLPLLRQTEVNPKAGYTFANAIKYFLRHDPDVLLVGEIRDPETAGTALTAAETGHMVLSTLHTNSAIGAIPRLQSLGIKPYMLADSLVGIVSQRLVRRICPSCKQGYTPSQEELDYIGDNNITELYRGTGCDHCGGTGYRGRTLIYEMLEFNKELRAMIGSGADMASLEAAARRSGFRDILHTALVKVKSGTISIEEVHRVLGHGFNSDDSWGKEPSLI